MNNIFRYSTHVCELPDKHIRPETDKSQMTGVGVVVYCSGSRYNQE